MNDLRSRIVVEVDGQLKTGRDVVVGALLGAEEFGFATAPLVALGCIMMRACHLNTCPVGVATQDPELRKRFAGDPEHVVNFMRFIAQEVREHMARLGFRTMDEMIGRSDRLEMRPAARPLEGARPRLQPDPRPARGARRRTARRRSMAQEHGIETSLDATVLLELAQPALTEGLPVRADAARPQRQPRRGDDARLRDHPPLGPRRPARTTPSTCGSRARPARASGRSSRAASPSSSRATRTTTWARACRAGGSSSGRRPASPFKAHENVIAGNVALYGATGGEAFIRGVAGERFAVRNSGAVAVVEGVGDHGCEYMTGGRVLVLGRTGRNFAAGMSGGVAWVYDADGTFASRCNTEMVGLESLAGVPDEADEVRALLERHRDLTRLGAGRAAPRRLGRRRCRASCGSSPTTTGACSTRRRGCARWA